MAGDKINLSFKDTFRLFNKRLILTCVLLGVSPFNYGFDNQGFSSIQSMDAFEKQFGEWDPKKKTYYLPTWWLSIFNAVPFVAFFFGILTGSMISKRFGRRMCVFAMSCWALMSASVIISSKNRDQMLAGRILNFFYVGMELSVIPVYQSEITPRAVRGFSVGAYHTALVIGGLVVNCIGSGTQHLEGNKQWLIPFGLFFTVPTIVVSTIWFLPESPRWLILHDRLEQARKNLHSLRVGAFSEEEIEEEWQQMVRGIHAEQAQEKGSYLDLFRGFNRRRTLTIIGINIFLQGTGQQFTSTYGAIFVKELGTINQFYYQILTLCLNIGIGFCTMYLQDRIGRRVLLFTGGTMQTVALMAMGGIGTMMPQTYSSKSAVVAMMIIYGCGYSIGWAAVSQTLNAELCSTHMRDHSFRTASITAIILQIAVTYALPYLLNAPYANLKSKVGFIFGAVSFIGIFYTYFCVPDCRGRSLEEIDRLFYNKVPAWKFHKVKMDTLQPMEDEIGEIDDMKSKGGAIVHEEKA